MNNNTNNNENNEFSSEIPTTRTQYQTVPLMPEQMVGRPETLPVTPKQEEIIPEVLPQVGQSQIPVTPLRMEQVNQEPVQPVIEPINATSVGEMQVNPVIETPNNYQAESSPQEEFRPMEDIFAPEGEIAKLPVKKKRKIKLAMVFLVVFALTLMGLGTYYVYSSNEKIIVNNSIKQLENFKNYVSLPNIPSLLNGKDDYSETGSLYMKASSNNKELSSYIDLINTLSFDYNLNKTTEKTLLELKLNKDNKVVLGAKLFANKDAGYVFLDKIFGKYIEVEDLKETLSSTNTNSPSDYEYLYNFAMKSLINNVSKDDFTKEKAEITINGETRKVNSLKLEYNDKEILELMGLVFSDIKKDTKADKIVENVYADFDKYDVKTTIADLDKEHMDTYTYTIYTDVLTNKVEGMDLSYKYYEENYNWDNCSSDDTTTNSGSDDDTFEAESMSNKSANTIADDEATSEDTDTYTTTSADDSCVKTEYVQKSVTFEYRNDKNPRVYLKEDKKDIGFIEFTQNEQTLIINVYKTEKEKLGYIKVSSTKTLFEITANFTLEKLEYKLGYSVNIEEVTADKEYNLDGIFTYEEYDGKEKKTSFTLSSTSNIKSTVSIAETVTDSVKYDDLTDADLQEIYTNVASVIAELTGQN